MYRIQKRIGNASRPRDSPCKSTSTFQARSISFEGFQQFYWQECLPYMLLYMVSTNIWANRIIPFEKQSRVY